MPLLALAAACGDDDTETSTTTTSAGQTTTTTDETTTTEASAETVVRSYLIRDEKVGPLARTATGSGAALDQPGSGQGGPYSDGTFSGSGQFGLLRIADDGRTGRGRGRGPDLGRPDPRQRGVPVRPVSRGTRAGGRARCGGGTFCPGPRVTAERR